MSKNPYEDLFQSGVEGKKRIPFKKSKAGEELSPEELYLGQKDLEEKLRQPTDQESAEQARVLEFDAEQSERKYILDELKKKEEENAKLYNEVRGKTDASRNYLRKMFGSSSETSQEVSDARLVWLRSLEEWGKQSISEIGEKLERGEITSKDADEQRLGVRNFIAHRIAEVRARESQKREEQGVERGWLSEKFIQGSKYILGKYKKLPFVVKLGLGVGFGVAGGYYAVVGIGAMRFLGGVISGQATYDKLQEKAEAWRKSSSLRGIRRDERQLKKEGLSVQEKLEQDLKSLEGMSEKIDVKAREEGYFDAVRKLGAWTIGGIVGSGTLATMWSQLGIGRAISEKIQHALGLDRGVAPGAAGVKGATASEGAGKGVLPTETTAGRFSGSGLEHTGHGEFSGDTAQIGENGNPWKCTRDLYIKNAENFGGYTKPNESLLHRTFDYYASQDGEHHWLRKLGLEGKSFSSLTPEEKMRIYEDWQRKTFNSSGRGLGIAQKVYENLTPAEKTKVWANGETVLSLWEHNQTYGEPIHDLVQAKDSILLNEYGKVSLADTSEMKSGYLSDIQRPRGVATYEPGGKGAVDTSQYDQIRESKLKLKQDIETALAGKKAQLGAEAYALNEQAIAKVTDANARLWNMWLEGLGGFRLNTPAHEIQEAIARYSPGIIGDAPLVPTPDEIDQAADAIRFTQEMFKKFPTLGNSETMQQYIERVARSNYYWFSGLRTIIEKKLFNLL